ncbi:MAG: imidazole glycerol phosphate synthase subunit HisH [Bacteroidales bacterium]|nr:imidazole glycerol phosphate synthase subunit HisH [Bacteroidales bacterium]HOK99591.1 imidazole glycerol phosphate synthase subunit HisH [Bacteroidales bacterium]HPO66044.1 imidazole glycerol phosphate synthase subunit HisH [Bacteroidales bacterium]
MKVAIIKYNAGNIRSVEFALKRLGVNCEITDDPERIKAADKVIFPGVGSAGVTMQYLRERKLDRLIRDLTQPVLGICLGQQLMCSYSEEDNTPCIGIFEQRVKKFEPKLKVPHMGWNAIRNLKSPLFNPELENQYVYFVHSYYVEVCEHTAATTDYIVPFSAAMHYRNFYATQFHPEKSGSVGETILRNFLQNT